MSQKKVKHNFRIRILLGISLLLFVGLIAYPIQAYSRDFQASIKLEKESQLKFDEPIVVNFSLPVATVSIQDGFSISPSEEVLFKWENNNRKVTITPKNYWKPQTVYDITIKNGRNILFQRVEKSLKFQTQDYPKIVSIFPKSGEKNIAVSMEEPVVTNFDRSLDGFNVKFVVDPEEALEYQLNENKTQIKLLASSEFKWKTDYDIGVFIKSKQQSTDDYKKIGQTNFQTESEPLPIEWAKDYTVRVAQAKQFSLPQIKTGKYIDINLAQQVMVIFEDSKPVDAYLISSGKRGMDSPTGNFKIENKANRAWSKKYGLFMPNWMAIVPSGEFGIHELPVWPGGYQEGASHLGTPVSHGCVRLGPTAAKRVYDWADLGTSVVIHK